MNALSVDPEKPEQRVVVGDFGPARREAGELVAEQAAEIERLRAEMVRMRGEMIVQRTALAFACEERAALEAAVPGLPRRARLARRVDALMTRMHDLMRERRAQPLQRLLPAMLPGLHGKSVLCLGYAEPEVEAARALIERSGGAFKLHPPPVDAREYDAVEDRLAAADLVVCQIGHASHEACRHVQDYCLRSGKHCLLVGEAEPASLSDAMV
jgi:hypothetical protein